MSVIGDFNDWDPGKHYLKSREQSGIWDGFLTGIGEGNLYKYHIESRHNNHIVDKADPFSSFNEVSPKTASIVKAINYEWSDQQWITERHKSNNLKGPMSIYEVHLGS
ncbi:MAG: 1,4-alpha-glucan branching enzyme, partial [Chloroflexi bacterium]|nr:1,4-alpha-glucan branching enzyme [Chloroflexota bacterium]